MSETQPQSPTLPELIKPQEKDHRRRRRHSRFRFVRRIRRRIKRLNWLLLLVMVAAVVAVVAMSALVLTINARNTVNDAWDRLDRAWSMLNSTPGTELTLTDFERVHAGVRDLQRGLTNARRQTAFLRPFDSLNADLETMLQSLDAAYELAAAADATLNGMQPALNFLTEGEDDETLAPQLSSGERVVELLSLGRGRFLSAQNHLDQAQAIIDGLDLANVSPDLFVTVDGLARYHDELADINSILLDSPDMLRVALGINDTQTYLVLSQNSDELRPSGGYTSTYGWMTVRNGRILDFAYSPTTDTSPNPPPASRVDQITVPDWWIRYGQPIYAAWDGSWYADFPNTARMAAWYYDEGGNPNSPVDGVISIDIYGFEYILEGLGEVVVPGYNETVTPETFRDAVYQIRAEGEGDVPHKRFLAALYQQIMDDWQSVDQDRAVELRGDVLRALQEKHIMVYFADERLNRAFDILNIWGAQKPASGQDYVMVADANLGNKSNRSILRQLTYDVEILTDGTLGSRLAVAYDYPARLAEADPAVHPEHYSDINYHTIIQAFVPAGSTLTGTANLNAEPVVVPDVTHTTFVTRATINYNQSERFQFSYTTPVLVETIGPFHRYKLALQKQPGMYAEPVNVQITLPEGARTINVSPAADASYQLEQPVLEFRLDLLQDREIEVIFMHG